MSFFEMESLPNTNEKPGGKRLTKTKHLEPVDVDRIWMELLRTPSEKVQKLDLSHSNKDEQSVLSKKPRSPGRSFIELMVLPSEIYSSENLAEANPYILIETRFNYKVRVYDAQSLDTGCWLTDELIDTIFFYLGDRCPDFSNLPKVCALPCRFFTFLSDGYIYEATKQIKKFDIFKMEMVLVAVEDCDHWALAVVNIKKKVFKLYDSQPTDISYLVVLQDFFQKEANRRGVPAECYSWKLKIVNGTHFPVKDCDSAVFMCYLAEHVSRKVNIVEFDGPYARNRLRFEIFNGMRFLNF